MQTINRARNMIAACNGCSSNRPACGRRRHFLQLELSITRSAVTRKPLAGLTYRWQQRDWLMGNPTVLWKHLLIYSTSSMVDCPVYRLTNNPRVQQYINMYRDSFACISACRIVLKSPVRTFPFPGEPNFIGLQKDTVWKLIFFSVQKKVYTENDGPRLAISGTVWPPGWLSFYLATLYSQKDFHERPAPPAPGNV